MGRVLHSSVLVLLGSFMFGCAESSSGPKSGDDPFVPGLPDLTVTVVQSTHEEFFAPSGFWISQYAIWIAGPGSPKADAGVVIGETGPVFISSRGTLTRTTAAAIAPGDTIQVWRGSVAYGAAQAPPGTPCYEGLQIVVVR